MKNILPEEKLTLLEIEVSEKIDNKNLKNFIYTNFKLKNITTNKNHKTFLIYIKELKKYQIFILNEKYDAKQDALKISHISIDGAPIYKRGRYASRGRSSRILKRRSHINLELKVK